MAEPLFVIVNLVLSSETEYVIPKNVASIAFHALDGDITMAHESGGPTWTLAEGDKESINTRDLQNQSLWFDGSATLEIRYMVGVLS